MVENEDSDDLAREPIGSPKGDNHVTVPQSQQRSVFSPSNWSSSSRWRLVGLLLALIALTCVFLNRLLDNGRDPYAPRRNVLAPGESTVAGPLVQVPVEFSGAPINLDDPRAEPFHELMREIQSVTTSGDGETIAKLFDLNRMLEETVRISRARVTQSLFDDALHQLKRDFPETLGERASDLAFTRFVLTRVELNDSGDEALLTVRQWDANGDRFTMRWWVARSDSWRLYNYGDMSNTVSACDIMSAIQVFSILHPHQEAQAVVNLGRLGGAADAIATGEFDRAEELIDEIWDYVLPSEMVALKHLLLARIAESRSDYELALDQIDSANDVCPDKNIVCLMRARVLNLLGRHEEALVQAQTLLETFGGDAETSRELALAFQGLNRYDEALHTIRSGLDDDPDSLQLLALLARSLPTEEAHEVGLRFMKQFDPKATLAAFVDSIWDQPDAALAVVEAYRESHPEDVEAILYNTLSLIELDRPLEALECVRPYLADDEANDSLAYLFYQSAILGGVWQDIYQSADDQPTTFVQLAEQMRNDPSLLRQLVASHQEAFPDAIELNEYLGVIAVWDEDWETAITRYRAVVDTETGELGRSIARDRLIEVMFQSGRSMEALVSVPPIEETFRDLMGKATMSETLDLMLMEELLGAYAAERPNDPVVPYWKVNLGYLRGHYAEVEQLSAEYYDALSSNPSLAREVEALHVYSLIHQGEWQQATNLAERIYSESGDPIFHAIVAAAQGELYETEKWMSQCVYDLQYQSHEFYEYEFLGERLRTEEFAALFRYYPPLEDSNGE